MLRKFLGKVRGNDADGLKRHEEAAVSRAAKAHGRLPVEGGRINTKSEGGYGACAHFLECLDAVAAALGLEPAPRGYRSGFTINYRALFPDSSRHYRVDVLEATVEQQSDIWVNGERFDFSLEAMRQAESLQTALAAVGVLLRAFGRPRGPGVTRPSRGEFQEAVMHFDTTWAAFEQVYITELIAIEEKARSLVVEAIQLERALRELEEKHGEEKASEMLAFLKMQKELITCIGRLNSVANFKRKGRQDLEASILDDSQRILGQREEGEEEAGGVRVLAADILETYQALRVYLREVSKCLERLDPHLCNNVGLVERLVDWEETWEVGARYLQHPALLGAMHDLVGEILAAQRLVPSLADMCTDCDVELFLCIPRLTWLRFCAEPARLVELMRILLPARFMGVGQDAQVDELVARFARTQELIRTTVIRADRDADGVCPAWELLVRRVVAGGGTDVDDEIYAAVAGAQRAAVRAEVEALMHVLEHWSIELQRHCPDDWNQFAALLVQCLGGGSPRRRQPQPQPSQPQQRFRV